MWNLERWCRWTYLQNRNRNTEVEDKYMDTEGWGWWWDGLGDWNWRMYTTICGPDGWRCAALFLILEWVAMPSSRGSSQSRDQTQVSEPPGKPMNTGVVILALSRVSSQPRNWTKFSCIAGRFFTAEVPGLVRAYCTEHGVKVNNLLVFKLGLKMHSDIQ